MKIQRTLTYTAQRALGNDELRDLLREHNVIPTDADLAGTLYAVLDRVRVVTVRQFASPYIAACDDAGDTETVHGAHWLEIEGQTDLLGGDAA